MPATKYIQHNPSCEAYQYDGTNAADIVAFAPGYAVIEAGKLVLVFPPNGHVEVQIGWYISRNEYPKDVFSYSFSEAQAFETYWEVRVVGGGPPA
jgi:hypothetical protein